MDGMIPSILSHSSEDAIARCRETAEKYGLTLTREAAARLDAARGEALSRFGRVEFGAGILDRLIAEFCGSPYISQDCLEEVLTGLQELFYYFKSECGDLVPDDGIIRGMRIIFDAAGGSAGFLSGVSRGEMTRLALNSVNESAFTLYGADETEDIYG